VWFPRSLSYPTLVAFRKLRPRTAFNDQESNSTVDLIIRLNSLVRLNQTRVRSSLLACGRRKSTFRTTVTYIQCATYTSMSNDADAIAKVLVAFSLLLYRDILTTLSDLACRSAESNTVKVRLDNVLKRSCFRLRPTRPFTTCPRRFCNEGGGAFLAENAASRNSRPCRFVALPLNTFALSEKLTLRYVYPMLQACRENSLCYNRNDAGYTRCMYHHIGYPAMHLGGAREKWRQSHCPMSVSFPESNVRFSGTYRDRTFLPFILWA
jgi:hypothetical protein